MVGKDNWRGFLDAIYSKWRLFLPILSPFLHSHSSPPTSSSSFSAPHLLARSYLSSLSFCFHLIFKREIWINFLCAAEETTSCELQILANAAIYLKWQIRRSNLLEIRRCFELSSYEEVCCFGAWAEETADAPVETSILFVNNKVQSEEKEALMGLVTRLSEGKKKTFRLFSNTSLFAWKQRYTSWCPQKGQWRLETVWAFR